MIKVLFNEWKDNSFFKEKIIKNLYASFNSGRPKQLNEILITNFQIKGDYPNIKDINILPSEEFEFLSDISLNFRGTIILEV